MILAIIWRAIISRHWILLCRSGRDQRRSGIPRMPRCSRSAAQRTEMPVSFIWEARAVAILYPREIDDAESALAETRAAMESGANHINEVCDAA